MANNSIIAVQDIPITVTSTDMDDYICIIDMAASKSENIRMDRHYTPSFR